MLVHMLYRFRRVLNKPKHVLQVDSFFVVFDFLDVFIHIIVFIFIRFTVVAVPFVFLLRLLFRRCDFKLV